MSLTLSKLLPSSPGSQGECLWVRESVHWHFRGMPEFPAAFPLTWTDGIPSDFHSQLLWFFFFLALVLWIGKTSVDLGPLVPQGALLQLRYPS